MNRSRNKGAALFAAIFLIVVLGALAITVALITTTQQVSSAQALDATRAYYAARARLEQEIASAIGGGGCSGNGNQTTLGFTTAFSCNAVAVQEGGAGYNVLTMTATAFRGDRASGTRVRRRLRVQLTAP